MSKTEFEIKDKDVIIHFGKYEGWTFKELTKTFRGMMYLKWIYREHTRLPEDARAILKTLYQKNIKYYQFPYSCPEVWAYSWAGQYPSLYDDSDEAVEYEREHPEEFDDFGESILFWGDD